MRGLTLIQTMVLVAAVGILAAVALPHYQRHVLKTRAQAAAADLEALRQTLENRFQKLSNYPVYASRTLIDAASPVRPETVARDFAGWRPSQGKWFVYSIISTADSYTVSAAGMGNMKCALSLDSKNTRTATGSACGFSDW